jgi:HAD superfamily hydrolase (TIGR01549 family)
VFSIAAKKFNLETEDIGKVFDENHDDITLGYMIPQELWKKCIEKYHLNNASDYDFLNSWVSDYRPIKEMHEFVKRIVGSYRIGLLSNIYKGMLPLMLDKGILPKVPYDEIIFTCDVALKKPDPAIYRLAEERAGVNANEILFIDDREDYIEGARKLGWNTYLFNNKKITQSVKELEKHLNNDRSNKSLNSN